MQEDLKIGDKVILPEDVPYRDDPNVWGKNNHYKIGEITLIVKESDTDKNSRIVQSKWDKHSNHYYQRDLRKAHNIKIAPKNLINLPIKCQ